MISKNLTLADYPQLLAELDPDQALPDGVTPETLPADWKRAVQWRCSLDPAHRWTAGIRARVRSLVGGATPGGKGACPWCWEARRSGPADWLAAELRKHFVFDPDQHKLACEGRVFDVDILIPSVRGRSVVIEFDGARWHSCTLPGCKHDGATSCRHNRDLKKSRAIEKMACAKYRVIRVRERPLDAGHEQWKRHRHWVYVPKQVNKTAHTEMLAVVLQELDRMGGFRPEREAPMTHS